MKSFLAIVNEYNDIIDKKLNKKKIKKSDLVSCIKQIQDELAVFAVYLDKNNNKNK